MSSYLFDNKDISNDNRPLADRMRPEHIDEIIGQAHLVGKNGPIRKMVETGKASSFILWGPPGSGKTTIARLVALHLKYPFMEFSAVMTGIREIKDIIRNNEQSHTPGSKPLLLFIDEIHRFNKAQQDAFLPHIEKGTIVLIGATTENPSFEVIPALLSRTHVYTVKQLSTDDILVILHRALSDTSSRGLGRFYPEAEEEALRFIAKSSAGDARVALTILENAIEYCRPDDNSKIRRIRVDHIAQIMQQRPAMYDKSGESHFNMISAFHKSLRGSDPDAALYWLSRMLDGGEDPLYILRRMVRFALEDVGLADPNALEIAVAAREAYCFLGSPEGDLALAHCAVYLATAPKSNRLYKAFDMARKKSAVTSHVPVPVHLRNAPTKLMKKLGYGKRYIYDHDMPMSYAGQEFLPEGMREARFYEPGRFGFEREIGKRLAWWRKLKKRLTAERDRGLDEL